MARALNFMPKEGMAARLLPWVIGIMVLLSGLAIALGLALNGSMRQWQDATARSLTVQIVSPDTAVLESEAKAAAAFLEGQPDIVDVKPLSAKDTASLLAPWLGKDVIDQNLPLPRMIDAAVREGAHVDLADLADQLKAEAPHARLDSHADWLDSLLTLSTTIQIVALAVIAVIAVATVAITIFATLSRLASHKESIELVHIIGAKDKTIAGEFQWRFLLVGVKGGIVGLVLVAIVVGVVVYFGRRLDPGLLPDLELDWRIGAALASLPFATGLITMLTARITALRVLSGIV